MAFCRLKNHFLIGDGNCYYVHLGRPPNSHSAQIYGPIMRIKMQLLLVYLDWLLYGSLILCICISNYTWPKYHEQIFLLGHFQKPRKVEKRWKISSSIAEIKDSLFRLVQIPRNISEGKLYKNRISIKYLMILLFGYGY